MKNVVYEKAIGTAVDFDIEYNADNQLVSIKNSHDVHQMNWTRGEKEWGSFICDQDLSVKVTREYTKQHSLVETYVFKNETCFDIYTMGTSLGIYVPFPDYYTDAATCMAQCCNTHIWCGGSSSYIMALRMGGEAPNLGLVLREGSLQGYSVRRMASTKGREEELSNHRGDFILHPENLHLRPGETYILSWEMFWFENKEEFKKILSKTPDFVTIEADAYVLLDKEPLEFTIKVGNSISSDERPVIKRNGEEIVYSWENDLAKICEVPENTGEYNYEITWKEQTSRASFLVMPDLQKLASNRCHFIAEYQQCRDTKSHLDGAYLIYDNEEHQHHYDHLNDHNGGRERVGMGVLLAYYLQHYPDARLQASLDRYIEYVLRELFDEDTGEVFNDMPRCRDFIRLYNYPWVSRLFLEIYKLKKDEKFLDRYYKSVEYFYHKGGSHFYAIGMPMYESVQTFREAAREDEAEKLLAYYKEQVDYMLACGRNYPAHEVDYEQSIVAPAAIYMCELYRITGEQKYKEAAAAQLEVLDLFQGFQPDYHLNEVAIRHWDGYWFGKKKCLGDTFPHYWSALSGYAYSNTQEIVNTDRYARKAQNTLRAVLSLFKEDGSASCAMVYPMSVNGKEAHFYDPWANDQDWGLYFVLKNTEF